MYSLCQQRVRPPKLFSNPRGSVSVALGQYPHESLRNSPTKYKQLDLNGLSDLLLECCLDVPSGVVSAIIRIATTLSGDKDLGSRIAHRAIAEHVLAALFEQIPLPMNNLPTTAILGRVIAYARRYGSPHVSFDIWKDLDAYSKGVSHEDRSIAFDALNAIRSQTTRLILYLHLVCSMPTPYIAEALGMSDDNVRQRVRRGRLELRQYGHDAVACAFVPRLLSVRRLAEFTDARDFESRSMGRNWIEWNGYLIPERDLLDRLFVRVAGLAIDLPPSKPAADARDLKDHLRDAEERQAREQRLLSDVARVEQDLLTTIVFAVVLQVSSKQ